MWELVDTDTTVCDSVAFWDFWSTDENNFIGAIDVIYALGKSV